MKRAGNPSSDAREKLLENPAAQNQQIPCENKDEFPAHEKLLEFLPGKNRRRPCGLKNILILICVEEFAANGGD